MSLRNNESVEATVNPNIVVKADRTNSCTDHNGETKEEKKSFFAKLKFILNNITVEPVLFFYFLPSVMNLIANQNLSMEKSCRVNLNLGKEVCDILSARNMKNYPSYKIYERNVQTLSAKMTVIKNILQSVIPGVLLLFLGSWSDRHLRRKPCIIAPVIGDIVMCFMLMMCVYFQQLPVEVSAVCEALPPALTGSWFAMFMGIYSYISDVSSEKERTLRVGAINMLTNISICIGTGLSGILYEQIGYYGVYLVSLVFYGIGMVYGVIFIKDTCDIHRESEDNVSNKLIVNGEKKDLEKVPVPELSFCKLTADLFRTKHVVDTLKSVVVAGRKTGYGLMIFAIIFLFVVIVGPLYGEGNVVYMFVGYRFNWTPVDYSFFSTFQMVANTLGTMLALALFTKWLKWDDCMLGAISCLSKVLSSLFYAFASTPAIFYLGAVVECLNGAAFIAIRTLISKMVPPDELGKVNSLFGVVEAIVPLAYGPLYSRMYAYTIDKFPGAFYIAGAALTTPAIFIFFLALSGPQEK